MCTNAAQRARLPAAAGGVGAGGRRAAQTILTTLPCALTPLNELICPPQQAESARAGVALRTLVYHEILLAYLAYIKQRGFTSMFIWACPPLQARRFLRHDMNTECYMSLVTVQTSSSPG